jgi:hypothetical protein
MWPTTGPPTAVSVEADAGTRERGVEVEKDEVGVVFVFVFCVMCVEIVVDVERRVVREGEGKQRVLFAR